MRSQADEIPLARNEISTKKKLGWEADGEY